MSDRLKAPPRCSRCGSETGVSFTGDGLCFTCHADATAVDLEPVDEFSVMVLAQLTTAIMESEGIAPTTLACMSEAFRTLSMLHLHAPEMLRRVALWYGDEDGRSPEELSRVAGEWARAVTDGARKLREAAARMPVMDGDLPTEGS